MSFTLSVYLSRERMPTRDAWQAAIVRASFPVTIDREFDADTFRGFLPCQYKGSTSGFEYFSRRLTEEDSLDLEVPGYDFSVKLAGHSGRNESQTALAVASSLCAASGGLLYDPQSGKTLTAETAVAWAAREIQHSPEDEL